VTGDAHQLTSEFRGSISSGSSDANKHNRSTHWTSN